MYIVRLSLFCAAALLVNGAYAKDFSATAGASAKTAEFTLATPQVRDYRVGELRQQTSRGARDDGQWLRTSDQGETDTANREPRPADSTPRWVF